MDKKQKKNLARICYIIGFMWFILAITNITGLIFAGLGIAFIILANNYYPIENILDLFRKDDDDDSPKPPSTPNATAPTTTATTHQTPKLLPPPRPLPPIVSDKEL